MATAPPTAKPVEIVKPIKRKRQPAPKDESKADRFKRLAMQRVPAAVKRLAQVANLFRGGAYESTPEQRQKCMDAIKAAYDEVVLANSGVKSGSNGFTL